MPSKQASLSSVAAPALGADASGWGANFWVTLVEPQVGVLSAGYIGPIIGNLMHCSHSRSRMDSDSAKAEDIR